MEDDLTFPQIIDGLSAPIATTTADGRVELANRQFLDYLGMSLEELKNWETSGVVHPDDLPRVVTAWRQSLERGEPYETRTARPARRRRLSVGSGSRSSVTRYPGPHPALVRAAHRHRRAQAHRSAPGRREAAPRDGGVRASSRGRSRGDVRHCGYHRRQQRLLDPADRSGWEVSPRGRSDAALRATTARSMALQSCARLDRVAPRLR